jgi:RimJ/RimL family protein N-acetyltransferase
MTMERVLRTERTLLREWRPADREPFAEMNLDPEVMEHMYPGTLSREQSDASADRFQAQFAEHGFGFWALELPGVTSFAGYVGLYVPTYEAHFTPCVEVGWRLARPHWGRGYATEAATAAMAFGFTELGLEEIVSMTVPANVRSWRVMERLGMRRDPDDDFEHPRLPEGHPLRPHVLYRKRAPSPESVR